MKFVLLACAVLYVVSAAEIPESRFKREPPTCPPPPAMIEAYKKMIADAKAAGVTIPAMYEPRDDFPCPPTKEMMDGFPALIQSIKDKGVTIPEALDKKA